MKNKNEERVIFSIDLKSFYATVECVDRKLDPFTTPLVVCDKERGSNTIILAVTPYLKSLGVSNRLRYRDLPKDIPNIIFAKPRMQRYIDKSLEVISIFLNYVDKDDLHVYSIDESFLDVTSYLKLFKCSAKEYAKRILDDIYKKTKLFATCGIGSNIFVAKCAMDVESKHNKDFIAEWNDVDLKTKLWNVTPLSKMWGIGSRLEKRLNNLGFYNVGDIANANPLVLQKHLGIIGLEIYNHANGIDEAIIGEKYTPEMKSLNCGQVLFRDYNFIEMKEIVQDMVEELCLKIRTNGYMTDSIGLMILYSKEIGGFSKAIKLDRATDSTKEIREATFLIYNSYIEDLPIRRINLSAFNLQKKEKQQLDFFTDFDELDKEYIYNKTLDEIKNKFGRASIFKMSALLKNSTAMERLKQIGGHNSE